MSVDEVIASLRPKLNEIPGIRSFLLNQPPINLGGGGQNRALYQFTMQDADTDELYKWAPVLEQRIRQMPGFEDVSSDLQLNNPQVTVEMDRDKLSSLGLTATQVETALYNAYGTRQVSQIYAPNNQYQVILRVAPEFQNDPAAMSLLYVRSNTGRLIPLESVARLKTSVGPLQVNHFGQLPSVMISFNLSPGFALGDAVTQIQHARGVDVPDYGVAAVPGRRAGVPGLAARAGPGAADGDRRHLHRAGRSLRELHASDRDSLGAALGRPRRAAHAADVRDRI